MLRLFLIFKTGQWFVKKLFRTDDKCNSISRVKPGRIGQHVVLCIKNVNIVYSHIIYRKDF